METEDKNFLSEVTIHKWIQDNHIKNEKGDEIRFNNHLFLYDIYADWSNEIVVKKSAQVGCSTAFSIKMAYAAKSPRFRVNSIYTLPTDGDVKEFVTTKFDPIVLANPIIKEMIGKDNTHLKEFDGRFVYFKGTRSESAAIMTTAELIVKDEVDRSDQSTLGTFESRTMGYKGENAWTGSWELSNPSVSNYGIDLSWKRSDQKEWFIQCAKCHMQQTLRWDRNVNESRGTYVCASCGKTLTNLERMIGQWIAQNPGSPVSGYHISNMMAPWMSAKDLIAKRKKHDDEYFQNFILGEPYSSGDVDDFRRIIYDCWTPGPIDGPPYILGVDVGRTKHYVLGNKKGIFKIGTCIERLELEEIIERYNPWVLMDAGPERTWAEEFRQKYPKFYINFYKRDRDTAEPVKFGKDAEHGVVWSDRSRSIDQAVTDMLLGEVLFDVEPKILNQFIAHWSVMVKRREVDAKGRELYSWDKNSETAADHWAHAFNYYNILRRSIAGDSVYVPGPDGKKTKFISESAPGKFKMGDVDEYLREKRGGI